MKLVLPSLLGMESLVAQEMEEIGYAREQISLQDGQVFLDPGSDSMQLQMAIARTNFMSACAARVELEMLAEDGIETFDALYDLVRSFPWNDWIPRDFAYVISGGYSRKSTLFGIPACQGIIKKAISASLCAARQLPEGSQIFEDPERGVMRFQFSFMENRFSLRLDTSGVGLHKRGYRIQAGGAPLKETLAAALVRLIRFRPFAEEALWDPFCGSGTLLIEAARWALEIPAGLDRTFAAEQFPWIQARLFSDLRKEAQERIDWEPPEDLFLYGTDLDPQVIRLAKQNAERAKVGHMIQFRVQDARTLHPREMLEETQLRFLTLLSNPPYGERLLTEEAAHELTVLVFQSFLEGTQLYPGVRMHIYTSDPDLEKGLGVYAHKRRKLYNGMIPCQLYQYFRKDAGRPYSPNKHNTGRLKR